MNWAIKIILKTLMTKISHISWGGYDKGGLRQRLLRYLFWLIPAVFFYEAWDDRDTIDDED